MFLLAVTVHDDYYQCICCTLKLSHISKSVIGDCYYKM